MMRTGLAAIALMVAAAAGGPCLASPETDARAFVESLYANYRNHSFCPACDGRERFFDTGLATLLKTDAKLANGEVGSFDGDPVCQCQDPDGMKAVILSVALGDPKSAVVKVELRFGGTDVRHATFDLARQDGQWRIHDIHSRDTASLRALLEDGIARASSPDP